MGRAIFIVTLVAVGFIVLYLLLKKKIERRTNPSAILGEIRDEVDRLIVELNQTTDRNVTLIEDRIAALGEKLSLADRKIALLQKESEKNELSSQVYSSILQKRAEKPPEPTAEDALEQVVQLHRSGVSSSAIAKRLGKPLAEVELIISLSARRGSGTGKGLG